MRAVNGKYHFLPWIFGPLVFFFLIRVSSVAENSLGEPSSFFCPCYFFARRFSSCISDITVVFHPCESTFICCPLLIFSVISVSLWFLRPSRARRAHPAGIGVKRCYGSERNRVSINTPTITINANPGPAHQRNNSRYSE